MVASLSFKPVLETASTKLEIRRLHSVINVENWRNTKYLIWLVAAPTAMFGYFVPFVHLVAYVKDILPEKNGEGLLTCIGITAGIGKILLGIIADRPNVNPVFLQQFSFVAIGIITMLLNTAPYFGDYAYTSMVILSLLLGVFDGCYSALLGPIAVYICGPRGASQAIGFILGLTSIPFMLGPLLAGDNGHL
jgi:MCP family monocarboxylic acid transporter-like MFS transporter 10